MKPHVHLADVDGDLVLMDTDRNQYFCIARDAAVAIQGELAGGNRFRGDAPLLDELEAAGLYGTLDRVTPCRPVPHLADSDILGDPAERLSAAEALALTWAAGRAWHRLRIRRPSSWLELTRRRNLRIGDLEANVSRVHALARHAYLARALFPGAARCLPNSLLLLELLALNGLGARWVFGVRTFPFEAHCWVEHDGVILNDTLDHVRWYTPIAEA
ncbi:lasso peptide biosynthesis B2 protein [Sphingomonas koreensis]|uniref:lasso peptide biosynthesis B2 protein n=1 Tax=Sphingomonas koreensis TaxID=93064 RepID=UPI0013DE3787|nr:lasso peptide biosynthesis B2 protein [Sphingomonas koreensis]